VFVGGRQLVQDGKLLAFDERQAIDEAARQRDQLLKRAEISSLSL
jgi:hypothetical protein